MTGLRIATFNVLADSYTEYGDYSHTPTGLMQPSARRRHLVSLINRLGADVVGLQEAERPLVDALADSSQWQTFWSPKADAPDGCLTLVRKGLTVSNFGSTHYADGSGHVAQITHISRVAIANTHIQWELANRLAQTRELLARLAIEPHAVLIGDSNDRPGGPAREMVAEAGFDNLPGDMPTAFIANREGAASLDLFAVRGLQAELVPIQLGQDFDIREIPSARCPSDHIPVIGQCQLP